MLRDVPADGGMPDYVGNPLTVLSHLGERTQGIFLLHHSLMAYPTWPQWDVMTGISHRDRFEYYHEQPVKVEVVRPHPITDGLASWEMVDETYVMHEPEADSETRPWPRTKIAACTRWRGRVDTGAAAFVYQSGHDDRAWSNPDFQEVVRRGLLWCAGRL